MIQYALITPARNEEAFIEKTIQSVISQTIRPQHWIIVNDQSTDRTGEIAQQYADEHDFMQVIHATGDAERNFGSKAKVIEFAYEHLKDKEFDYIGNLDADISFEPEYYEQILGKLEENPKLGLAGGIRYDMHEDEMRLIDPSRNSVGGPIQLFRRECYEQIGGYVALPYGGIDAVAEICARMNGWEVRSFPEYRVYHHRPTGTAGRSVWSARLRGGYRDYTIGYHILFEFFRMLRRMVTHKPYVIGASLGFLGYLIAMFRGFERPVSDEMIEFLHEEQLERLKRIIKR